MQETLIFTSCDIHLCLTASLWFLQLESWTGNMIGAISQLATVTLTTVSQNKPIAVERDRERERTTDWPSGDSRRKIISTAWRETNAVILSTWSIYIRDETQEMKNGISFHEQRITGITSNPHHQYQRGISLESGLTY